MNKVHVPLSSILAHATEEELRVLLAVIERVNAQAAIVVTMRDNRRYVVSQEDEHLFADIPDGPVVREDRWDGPQSWFGGQWLRGYGRVDEMHRSLAGYEIAKVARVDRKRVWGD
jgi:hypothetical protein